MESYLDGDQIDEKEEETGDQLFAAIGKLLQKDKELEKLWSIHLIKAQPADSCTVPGRPPELTELLNLSSVTPSIDSALLYNSGCKQVLRQVEKQLEELLEENRRKQKELSEYITSNKKWEDDDDSASPFIKCAGIPYFKDKDGFLPPWNNDVMKKILNDELLPQDFITSNIGSWNKKEYKELEGAVIEFVKNSKINKLRKKQSDIVKADPKNNNEVEAIENEIEEIKNKPSYLLNINSSEVDWLRISSQHMKGRYSDFECEAKWNLELDPRLNKSVWKSDEIKKLKAVALKNNYQDWDLIAQKLNTNRSAYQCCVQYQSMNSGMEGKWTPEEDEKLKELVAKYKIKNEIPWKKIAWYFDSRSIRQCRERYAYGLNHKKGHFNDEEDCMIITKLKECGHDFAKVSKIFPDRNVKQIRSRYDYLVGQNMEPFTTDEEALLIKLVNQYSKNWKLISPNFENRSALQCRKAWEKIGRKIVPPEDDSGSEDLLPEDFPLTLQPTDEIEMDIKPVISKKNSRKSIDTSASQKSTSTSRNSLDESMNEEQFEQSTHYKSLLKYLATGHEFSYGPKSKIAKTPEEMDKSSEKMKAIMSMLGINCNFPSILEAVESIDSCEFNSEDLMILKRLCETESVDLNAQLVYKNLIPPNYNTLVGLRSLILGRDIILASGDYVIPENMSVSNPIPPNDRLLFTDAKSLFKNRLKSLFAMPIICSLTNPETIPNLVVKTKTKKNKAISRKRKKNHGKKMVKLKKLSKEANSDEVDNLKIPVSPLRKRGRPRRGDSSPITKINLKPNTVSTRRTVSATSTSDE